MIIKSQAKPNWQVALLASLFMGATLVGCSASPPTAPSIFVVAVDGLNFESSLCGQTVAQDGVVTARDELCRSFVRFTHAYAPSTMAQANVTSLLTGKHPAEHGVWHNGPQSISAKLTTLAELALAKGYRTVMVSGGAPIFARAGIDQGFEFFDDAIVVRPNQMYRPVQEVFKLLNDYRIRYPSEPVFGVAYLADLQFPDLVTRSDLGEERSANLDGQLAEIDEHLSHFFRSLKQQALWHSSHVVVIGVSGQPRSRDRRVVPAVNLHVESTQIALFIKPSGPPRDLGLAWSVDTDVSIVDVGFTIRNWLDPSSTNGPTDKSSRAMPKISDPIHLTSDSVIKRSVPEMRWLLQESGWPEWHGVGNSILGIRRGHFLYLHMEPPLIYDTAVDRFENSEISIRDSQVAAFSKEALSWMESWGFPVYRPGDYSYDFMNLMRQIVDRSNQSDLGPRALQFYARKPALVSTLTGWMVRKALGQSDWKRILEVNRIHPVADWQYVAEWALSKEREPPAQLMRNPCWYLLVEAEKQLESQFNDACDDELMRLFERWIHSKTASDRSFWLEKFLPAYFDYLLKVELVRANWQRGLIWDVADDAWNQPTRVELALALPRFRRQASVVSARWNEWSNRTDTEL